MKTFRQLLEDIQVGPAPEEISYKGYTTKNLHHVPDAAKAFQATITRVQKGTLADTGEVLSALKATDTYMKLNDMHLEQEQDLDSQELEQWLAAHEEAKSALTKIGEFEHHYDYWNSHSAELQYLKANQNMPQEAESVKVDEASKLQGTPVVSLSDFGSKDTTKNKYGQTVSKKLKPNDPRVKMYTEPKKEGVTEMDNRTASGDRREQRANSPEAIAQREKELQANLKKVSLKLRKKLRLPSPKEEGVSEGLADDFLAMAKNRNPNARIVTAVQKRKETEELMKKREASGTKPAHAAPTSNPRPLGGHDPKSGRSYSESIEPIDELSKTTLGSYIKKRSHDVATQGAMTRQHAVDAAKEKEAQGGYTTSSVRDKEQKADKAFMKGWKQRMNIAKAVDRLTKEEVEETEQIDEISAELKQKYLSVATKKHLQQFMGREKVRDKQELDKRRAAIQKTSKELTGKTYYQESLENVEEGFVGRETKDGTWRVFKTGQAVAVAGPFKSREEASAWIKKQSMSEEVELGEALDFKKEAAKHMKDMHDKNATPTNKAYAQKMLQRALEASKIKDKAAAAKHYMGEEVELDEKTLTPAELKKREEVAKAMERKNPNMDKSRKMAIATAVAKRVAEQYDDAE